MLLYQIMMILFLDLKKLYFQAGVENKPTVFLFNDIQVQWNSNQILSTYLSFFWYVTEPITIVCCFSQDKFDEVQPTVCWILHSVLVPVF